MAEKNKLKYYILADHTGFEKGMKKVVSTAKTAGKAVGVGVAAGAVAGTAALAGMTKVMSESIELAKVQEEAEAKLGAVLRATGNAAGYNLDQLTAMAGAMQGVTTVGDETIIAGQAILATFKQIKGDAFEGATQAALDMSAVMNQDLKSSMVQIGKAMNDPIKGLSSLTRVGVTFTDEQKELITTLQESGDMMGAQSVILDELNSQFGGAAAALRATYGGAVNAASNALGDLQEQIGFAVTKNQFFIDAAILAEETLVSWTGEIKNNEQAMMELAKSIAVGLVGALDGVITGIEYIELGFRGLEVAAALSAEVIVDVFTGLAEAVIYPFDELMEGVKKAAAVIGKDFENPLAGVRGSIADIRDVQRDFTAETISGFTDAGEKYDIAHSKLAEFRTELELIDVAQVKATESSKQFNAAIVSGAEDTGDKTKELDKETLASMAETKAENIAKRLQLDEGYVDSFVTLERIKNKESEKSAKERTVFEEEFADISKAATADIVSAFVSGEDTKVAVAGVASSYLEQYAIDSATKGLEPIFEAIGSQIGAWVALGTGQSGSNPNVDWKAKLGEMAGYLAGAGVAILGAKAVGKSAFAEGGWIHNNGSGFITDGSWKEDDVFLGYTGSHGNITANMAKGGEFVMDPETTAANYDILESMRMSKKRYKGFASGGPLDNQDQPVSDPYEMAQGVNAAGFETFFVTWLESGKWDGWKQGIKNAAIYYSTVAASSVAGKELGPDILSTMGFAEGGQLSVKNHGFGDILDKITDPFGINDKIGDIKDKLDPVVDPVGIGGDINQVFSSIWLADWLETWADGGARETIDRTIAPFFKDVLTPNAQIQPWGHIEEQIDQSFTEAAKRAVEAGMENFTGYNPGDGSWNVPGILDPTGPFDLFHRGGVIGSYETGTPPGGVPYDGLYNLHKGEDVVSVPQKSRLAEEIQGLKEELAMLLSATSKLVVANSKMEQIFSYWNGNGMPPERATI